MTERRGRGPRTSALAIALLGAVLGAGCGIEEFPTSLGEGAIPGDPLNPWPSTVTVDVSVSCECTGGGGGTADAAAPTCDPVAFAVDDLAGHAWRFDTLVLTAPNIGPLQEQLNSLFADSIEANTMNVLLVVDEDTRADCRVSGRLGAGDPSGDGYAFRGEPDPITLALTTTGFRPDEPAALDFPNDFVPPPILPLQQLELTGTFTAGADRIEDGTLRGALAAVDVEGTTFGTMLKPLAELDVDLDGDGTMDAWRFVGDFTAAATVLP